MSGVAASMGVSRSTVYKWIGRYCAGGTAALVDGSSAPRSMPHWVELVVPNMTCVTPRIGSAALLLLMEVAVSPACRTTRQVSRALGLFSERHETNSKANTGVWQVPALSCNAKQKCPLLRFGPLSFSRRKTCCGALGLWSRGARVWAAGGQRAAERPIDGHSAERVVHGLPTRPEGRAPVRRTRPQIHSVGQRSRLSFSGRHARGGGLDGRRQGWSGGGL